MKVLRPVAIADAMLLSSSLSESEHAAYVGATTYSAGERVIHAHYIYESLQGGNVGRTPGAPESAAWWLEVGPTNRWAMFDQQINTGSSGASPISVTLQPSAYVDSVAILDAEADTVRVQMLDGATTVFDQTVGLSESVVADWRDYFFEPFLYTAQQLITGLPLYLGASITITVSRASGAARVGGIVLGEVFDLGDAQSSARAGIVDYSRRETNAFGVTQLVRRNYARRMEVALRVPTAGIRRLQNLLSALRATPCVWVGVPGQESLFSPLVVFGFVKDFELVIEGPVTCTCDLQIEGMI